MNSSVLRDGEKAAVRPSSPLKNRRSSQAVLSPGTKECIKAEVARRLKASGSILGDDLLAGRARFSRSASREDSRDNDSGHETLADPSEERGGSTVRLGGSQLRLGTGSQPRLDRNVMSDEGFGSLEQSRAVTPTTVTTASSSAGGDRSDDAASAGEKKDPLNLEALGAALRPDGRCWDASFKSASTSRSTDSLVTGFRQRSRTIETDKIRVKDSAEEEQINQYKMFQQLGKGTYGTVKLCQHTESKDYFACKCLSKKRIRRKTCFARGPRRKGSAKDDGLQDLKREVAILKKIDHPHIVKLYEVMNDPEHDTVYMIFELLRLGPVMDMTQPETVQVFSEDKSRVYFRQLVLAIEFLHNHNVIHRDIKPSNLLLFSSDYIKVADFGVSHVLDSETKRLYKTAGTPAFMAPEAINTSGDHYDGQPVDVWAMGVTLYCFLVGKAPWSGTAILDLHEKIRTEPRPLIDSISPDCKDVFAHILDKNPVSRWTLDQLRLHPWVTRHGATPLPTKQMNCAHIVVTQEEVDAGVTDIKPETLNLIRSMLRNKSFSNPKSKKRSSTFSTSRARNSRKQERARLVGETGPVTKPSKARRRRRSSQAKGAKEADAAAAPPAADSPRTSTSNPSAAINPASTSALPPLVNEAYRMRKRSTPVTDDIKRRWSIERSSNNASRRASVDATAAAASLLEEGDRDRTSRRSSGASFPPPSPRSSLDQDVEAGEARSPRRSSALSPPMESLKESAQEEQTALEAALEVALEEATEEAERGHPCETVMEEQRESRSAEGEATMDRFVEAPETWAPGPRSFMSSPRMMLKGSTTSVGTTVSSCGTQDMFFTPPGFPADGPLGAATHGRSTDSPSSSRRGTPDVLRRRTRVEEYRRRKGLRSSLLRLNEAGRDVAV